MTQQQTAVEQQSAADQQTVAEPPQAEQATTIQEQPAGTRELRDAQQASAGAKERPPIAADAGATAPAHPDAPLFDDAAGSELRERWLVIQTEFVDEPRAAVEKADALVAEVLKQLTDTFAREREGLEAAWSGSGGEQQPEVSTEDLRQAIQRYRSFFNRLLTL